MMVTGKSQRCGNANKADEQQTTMLASSEYDIFNQDLLSILLTNKEKEISKRVKNQKTR